MVKIEECAQKVLNLQLDTFVSPHQFIIDTLEDVYDELCCWQYDTSLEELLGSLQYKVDTLIEVINPEYKKDDETLEKLSNILKSYS